MIKINKYLKEYITLKKNYERQGGDSTSVLALYEFKDRLSVIEGTEAKSVLVDVYQQLGMMKSAYLLFLTIIDQSNKKQMKKLALLQELCKSDGDKYALPGSDIESEQTEYKERLKHLPKFRYHPNPLGTGVFKEGEARVCPCCGNKSTVYYCIMPYCIETVEYLCPTCIANGEAAKKYDASFVQDAEWVGEIDNEKDDELFNRTPGYLSWQGEHWLSCCGDYCAYLGTVGTRELKAMDIADKVFAEYATRDEFECIEEYLVKDGSLCGYLFRCLHCGKYQIWVDAD